VCVCVCVCVCVLAEWPNWGLAPNTQACKWGPERNWGPVSGPQLLFYFIYSDHSGMV